MAEQFEEMLGHEIADIIREQLHPLRRENLELRHRIAQVEAVNLELMTQVKFLKDTGINFRDVFEDGKTYNPGDAVIASGCLWRAHSVTKTRPPGDAWRLVCKKGRDGKDGR